MTAGYPILSFMSFKYLTKFQTGSILSLPQYRPTTNNCADMESSQSPSGEDIASPWGALIRNSYTST